MKALCFVFVIFASIYAQPQLQRYTLPSGADLLLPGGYNTGFSCEGRIYGYYADTTNDCHVFYVCVPVTDEAGITTTYQYPFICGNQTKFNQEHLTCDYTVNVDCSIAETFYSLNEEFGKISEQFKTPTPPTVIDARRPVNRPT